MATADRSGVCSWLELGILIVPDSVDRLCIIGELKVLGLKGDMVRRITGEAPRVSPSKQESLGCVGVGDIVGECLNSAMQLLDLSSAMQLLALRQRGSSGCMKPVLERRKMPLSGVPILRGSICGDEQKAGEAEAEDFGRDKETESAAGGGAATTEATQLVT